ncbi:MAG: PhzF family phenazine biosynthesis protein [Motiliproteus sp.]
MQSLRYFTLDVFTDTPFAGNPLAVFPDAEGLDSRLMQSIARELNLSETVFIGQATAPNRFAMRIFTPSQEMPFAGHPTVGTALLLERLGMLDPASGDKHQLQLILEQGIGDVAVSIDLQAKTARFKTAQLPQVTDSPLSKADASELLGLRSEQVRRQPFIASCGYPFHMIELNDLQALAAAKLNSSSWEEKLSTQIAPEIYLYCRPGENTDIRARMFAPAAGITEDPATGSAAAALVGALGMQQQGDGILQLGIEQGVEMGRSSSISSSVCFQNSAVTAVYIAGKAVMVSEGGFFH